MKQIYKFSATWCQPCKVLAQRLEQRGITLPNYDIDVPDNRKLLEKYNVRSVPAVVVDDDGLVQVFTGSVVTEAMLEAVK